MLKVLEVLDGLDVLDMLSEVDLGLPDVVGLDEVEAAAVDAGVKKVLVLPKPATSIIVCACPSEIENVPFPLWQSQVPASAAGPQHQLPFPQNSKDPLFCWTGSSIFRISNF